MRMTHYNRNLARDGVEVGGLHGIKPMQESTMATASGQRYELAGAGRLLRFLKEKHLLTAFLIIAFGRVLNLIVIAANDGVMPIITNHVTHANLPVLADWISIRVNIPINGYMSFLGYFSIGDMLIFSGLLALVVLLIINRREVSKM